MNETFLDPHAIAGKEQRKKQAKTMSYKAMYKNELARAGGVSLKVLNRWLEPHRQQLAAFGVGKYDKMLPPSAVRYICITFDIEL